jgi:hypothetical protein
LKINKEANKDITVNRILQYKLRPRQTKSEAPCSKFSPVEILLVIATGHMKTKVQDFLCSSNPILNLPQVIWVIFFSIAVWSDFLGEKLDYHNISLHFLWGESLELS